jgi:hypothetical protein
METGSNWLKKCQVRALIRFDFKNQTAEEDSLCIRKLLELVQKMVESKPWMTSGPNQRPARIEVSIINHDGDEIIELWLEEKDGLKLTQLYPFQLYLKSVMEGLRRECFVELSRAHGWVEICSREITITGKTNSILGVHQ